VENQAYLEKAQALLGKIAETQKEAFDAAAEIMAESIATGNLVNIFGSGHSVIPALDIFPRYGSYVGFRPLMDPRLMWFSVVGPGGAPELLWIERQEGYVKHFLKGIKFSPHDTMVVFSHGGLNAAPIEAAMYAKDLGMKVIAVTSGENYRVAKATHSSGKKLGDIADVTIDNCVPLEDALIKLDGVTEPVAAGSTLAIIAISMNLVAEVAKKLNQRGVKLDTFVSPNVQGVSPDHNAHVFERYQESLHK
jgi:uncharacterized phosphosugar-binding protein